MATKAGIAYITLRVHQGECLTKNLMFARHPARSLPSPLLVYAQQGTQSAAKEGFDEDSLEHVSEQLFTYDLIQLDLAKRNNEGSLQRRLAKYIRRII